MQVWYAVQRLSLGLTLIALASAVLLVSRSRPPHRRCAAARVSPRRHRPARLDARARRGRAGHDRGPRGARVQRRRAASALRTYNAQGDLATGNAIARQVTTGEFDLVLTSSTPSMQAVANANRDGRTQHVFGLVADPFSAGVGLDRAEPAAAPARTWSASGSFLPVDEAFALARARCPR